MLGPVAYYRSVKVGCTGRTYRAGEPRSDMEVPLTPLEFARRTRRLHGHREGVVDGGLRLTYEQFFGRCDRW